MNPTNRILHLTLTGTRTSHLSDSRGTASSIEPTLAFGWGLLRSDRTFPNGSAASRVIRRWNRWSWNYSRISPATQMHAFSAIFPNFKYALVSLHISKLQQKKGGGHLYFAWTPYLIPHLKTRLVLLRGWKKARFHDLSKSERFPPSCCSLFWFSQQNKKPLYLGVHACILAKLFRRRFGHFLAVV